MSKKVRLHFGGLWAPLRSGVGDRPVRPALLFLGDMHVVRFDYKGPKQIEADELHYMIEDDQFIMEPLDDESSRPLIRARWRLVDDRLLEFTENGVTSVWEPVRVEEMAEEGYPTEIFEGYRKAFLDAGSFYTIEGLAPHPSALEAVKNTKRRKPKK